VKNVVILTALRLRTSNRLHSLILDLEPVSVINNKLMLPLPKHQETF